MPDGDAVQFQSPTTGNIQPVPPEHWDAALSQGYKPTTHKVMYSPDGQRGMVRNEEMPDYMKQGFQTTPRTQFEKDRPGKGITTEGMGGEAWEGAKRLGSGALSMVDPTRGLSGAGLSVLGLNPRSGGAKERLSEVPIVGAAKEAAAAYRDPSAKPWEVPVAGAGALTGMSASEAREAASRGEGGKILGQVAVPTALAAAAPLAEPIAGKVPAIRDYIGEATRLPKATDAYPGGRLKPGVQATARLLGAGAGHLTGIPGIGEFGGWVVGPGLADMLLPGHPNLPGPFSKLPTRMPTLKPVKAPLPPPFEGATSSANVLGNAELPRVPPTLQGSSSLFPQRVEMVDKFTQPEKSRIVSPESTAPDYKVTYQSVPQAELRGKVMTGDIEAIREWQRRGLELPPNVRFMVEGDAGGKPWRAYKR